MRKYDDGYSLHSLKRIQHLSKNHCDVSKKDSTAKQNEVVITVTPYYTTL